MNEILLSFIVPMYNSIQYIQKCIDSIESQGIPKENYEIVVIDDGSNDGGGNIVQAYDSVVYFRQENAGQSSARNKGIELSRGKYLCFVDSDDMLIPNTYSFVLEVALKNNVDVVAYDGIQCLEEEIEFSKPKLTNNIENVLTGYEYIEKHNFNNGPWWYICAKKVLGGDLRFVNGRYAEDGMFTMSLLMKVKTIIHVNNDCYYYIRRQGSTTTKRDIAHVLKMVEDYYYAYSYMGDLIEANKSKLSQRGLERCISRSLTYIFFLLVRLLYLPSSVSREWYQQLSSEHLLPICQPYSGPRFKVTTFILNHYYLFNIVRFIIHNFQKLSSNRYDV